MNTFTQRINDLRQSMKSQSIDAMIIPRTDAHLSEYISDHWHVVRFLSGFTGSAATMLVTLDKALLWTDSRYFLQAAQQLAGTGIELMKEGLPDTPDIPSWLCQNLHKGNTVGIDGMTMSIDGCAALAESLAAKGINIRVDFSPIDTIWTDRPSLPADKIFVHDIKYAGEDAKSKISRVLANVAQSGASTAFLSALDEIAWTLNIRSNDVPDNPVATSFLYLSPKGSTIFVDPVKMTPEVEAYLKAADVQVMPYTAVKSFLGTLADDEKMLMSATQNAVELAHIAGDRVVRGKSPVAMLKAVKNDIQLAGTREAMKRDGAALVYSFMEIENRLASGAKLTEMDVAEILTRHRSEQPLYFEDSFATIAGFGAHGAIVHYTADEQSNAEIKGDNLLLIDSGANYIDGTTDITRTIAIGTPTAEMKHDFTRVMQG
ncbi:MAG: aminopeptidase P family N-terminal domain-containing protein, partial [Muribaculaceae bacterium]|nr:aminopeptidase P family N-terminal domain-containing protein [Muribaculaceae bacterium]